MRLETIRRPFWPTLRGNQFEYPLFWQPKIPLRKDVHSVDAPVLYGNTIYSVRGILFNCINPDRITLQQMFFSTIWDISLRSNRRPFLICILLVKDDKEEGIRWRSYHLDQLQSWKSSQVRLVKISVGVIMLTERFCPVLMLRPFKKHSANTTTQKIK